MTFFKIRKKKGTVNSMEKKKSFNVNNLWGKHFVLDLSDIIGETCCLACLALCLIDPALVHLENNIFMINFSTVLRIRIRGIYMFLGLQDLDPRIH